MTHDHVPSRFRIRPRSSDRYGGYEVLVDDQVLPWAIGAHGAEAPMVTQTEVPGLKYVTLSFMVDGTVDLDPGLVFTHLGEGRVRVERPSRVIG